MQTSAFDFSLPDDLIAQHPVEPRDRARLMVVRTREARWEHRSFSDLPSLLDPGDILVRNTTRVVPARLVGQRESTGGKWEGLFLRDCGDGVWEMLATTRGRPNLGERVVVGQGLCLTLEGRGAGGSWIVRHDSPLAWHALLDEHGQVPLPPYIRKGREAPGDRQRYQTIYAREPGAVAAPTAGLHFTDAVFDNLAERGIGWTDATLHVGIGTFRPIEAETIEEHVLHPEWGAISTEAVDLLQAARARGNRIVAVGTTSARVLETAASSGRLAPFAAETALYLRPGHTFRGLDALITNFHLPRSSLLVLVSALAGVELTRAVYAEAVRERYRFYSYGDAMIIL